MPCADPVSSNGANGHHHHHHRNGGGGGGRAPPKPFGKANSQGTMSTRSTMSQGSSWEEEDRSVGGEVELEPHRSRSPPVGVASADLNFALPRPPRSSSGSKPRSPSLHETHFDGSDFDLPRTVLHHPDPYTAAAAVPAGVMAQHPSTGVGGGMGGSGGQYQPLPYYQQVRKRMQNLYRGARPGPDHDKHFILLHCPCIECVSNQTMLQSMLTEYAHV